MKIEEAVPWLRMLSPSASRGNLTPASSGAQLVRATDVVGSAAVQWAIEVGHDVAERVSAEIPAHVGKGGLDVLRMGTEATILQLLMTLAGIESELPATAESLGGIPDFVRRRVSLEAMLRGIALGHAVIAAAVLTECGRLGEPQNRHEQMRALSQRMFVFFDAFSAQMAAAYREEESRWEQSETANRLAVVDRLLRGHELPHEDITRRLRYDITRTHVALIVWSTQRTLDADDSALHEATQGLIREVGCEQKLIVSGGLGVVWAWVSVKPALISDVSGRLGALQLPAGVHAVTGLPGAGTRGFRASHDEAVAAFSVRSVAPVTGVTLYREVDLLSLLIADRPRALRFARAELGPLAAPEPAIEELRRTLAAYFDGGESTNAAAQLLQISRNTVTYRIRRVEEMMGRPVTERRQQLHAALTIFVEGEREAWAK